MSDSQVVEWLNENQYRAYPLVSTSPRILTITTVNGPVSVDQYALFLDANFVFRTSEHPGLLQLKKIVISNNAISFYIEDLPSFGVNMATTPSYPLYIVNANNDLLVIGEELTAFYTSLAVSGTAEYTVIDTYFEPSVACELRETMTGVTGLTANTASQPGPEINLIEGYQTDIQFIGQNIQISVGRNEGVPLGCIQWFPDLTADCSGVVSYINGATPVKSGEVIYLRAGPNVKLYEDKEKGRIYIGLDFNLNDTCKINTLPPQP